MAANIPLVDTFIVVVDKQTYVPVAVYDPRFYLKSIKQDKMLVGALIESYRELKENMLTYRGESKEVEAYEKESFDQISSAIKNETKILFFSHCETKHFLFLLGVPSTHMEFADKLLANNKIVYYTSLKYVAEKVEKKFGKEIENWKGNINDDIISHMENYLYKLAAESLGH